MPSTPLYNRRSSSSLDYFPPSSPQSAQCSPIRPTRSRQSSLYSLHSPSTPRPNSSHSQEFGFANGPGTPGASGNGLGNLADELAEAWDEDAVDGGVAGKGEADEEEEQEKQIRVSPHQSSTNRSFFQRRMGIGKENGPLKQVPKSKRRWKPPGNDGSEDGYHSSCEDPDTTASLEAQIAAIEKLANPNEIPEGGDDVCNRVAESLRDLNSQIGIEHNATSLAQAQTAFSNSLNNHIQVLHKLIHPLLSPLSQYYIDPTAIALLVPDIQALILSLPELTPHSLIQIHAFHASTQELLSTLSSFSDTLHMTRQTSTQASRRLRVAKETVENLRTETEKAEEGIAWVEKGQWQERIERREAAKICGEICGGFEEVCEDWRRRLLERVSAR